MKLLLLFILSLNSFIAFSQSDSLSAIKEIEKLQKELNEEYKNPEKSPLEHKDLKRFKEHSFYPVNLKYRVKAELIPADFEPVFKMKTSTSRLADYKKYGVVKFSIDNVDYELNVYQSMDLLKKEAYKNYLFLPFTDKTNDAETYKGGRYIGLFIPDEGDLIIDFNQAYNPYCAYSVAGIPAL